MSYNLFYSWANWVKTKIEADNIGVNIGIDSEKSPPMPYLFLEDGPESVENEYTVSMFVQARLMVKKIQGQQIEVTSARLMDKIIKSLRDPGLIPHNDYNETPPKQVGYLNMRREGMSPELSSNPEYSQKVLRFEIFGNGTV